MSSGGWSARFYLAYNVVLLLIMLTSLLGLLFTLGVLAPFAVGGVQISPTGVSLGLPLLCLIFLLLALFVQSSRFRRAPADSETPDGR